MSVTVSALNSRFTTHSRCRTWTVHRPAAPRECFTLPAAMLPQFLRHQAHWTRPQLRRLPNYDSDWPKRDDLLFYGVIHTHRQCELVSQYLPAESRGNRRTKCNGIRMQHVAAIN